MNICHDYFERVQIFDSYASRKGKGVQAAINRSKEFTNRYDYFLKLDIKKFFASLHHEVIKKQVRHIIKDRIVLSIFDTIIESYEISPQRGVPIGNLTSQYLANHYLFGLDHFIKEKLQIKGYVRYMDDLILWHNDKNLLKESQKAIENHVLTELSCQLKPELLNFTSCGLPFLGYLFFPYKLSLLQRSKRRFFEKSGNIETKLQLQEWTELKCQRHVRPLLSFIKRANAEGLKVQFA